MFFFHIFIYFIKNDRFKIICTLKKYSYIILAVFIFLKIILKKYNYKVLIKFLK